MRCDISGDDDDDRVINIQYFVINGVAECKSFSFKKRTEREDQLIA